MRCEESEAVEVPLGRGLGSVELFGLVGDKLGFSCVGEGAWTCLNAFKLKLSSGIGGGGLCCCFKLFELDHLKNPGLFEGVGNGGGGLDGV